MVATRDELLVEAGRAYDPYRHDPDSIGFDDSYAGPSERELMGGCSACGGVDDCYCLECGVCGRVPRRCGCPPYPTYRVRVRSLAGNWEHLLAERYGHEAAHAEAQRFASLLTDEQFADAYAIEVVSPTGVEAVAKGAPPSGTRRRLVFHHGGERAEYGWSRSAEHVRALKALYEANHECGRGERFSVEVEADPRARK